MSGERRLMAVLAHPDDESLGLGGTLASYAAAGVRCQVVSATRGERGRFFDNQNRPSDEEVGRVREDELRAAAAELGVEEVSFLGWLDGELNRADPARIVGQIADQIRQFRPQVVLTFDPFGAYGHPDHIAICQFATAAVVAALDPNHISSVPAFRVDKLYYRVNSERTWAAYEAAFRKLVSRVDGEERVAMPWPDWSITTELDTRGSWERVWRAVQCHRTQLAIYGALGELGPEHHEGLWGSQSYYRALSLVQVGPERETDLFSGIS